MGNAVRSYRPSKTVWFWSLVGVCALTIGVGFTWGGWVTQGTAQEMAQDRAQEVAGTLGATICVDRFMSSPEARSQLIALKDESSFGRDDFVEEGGWATIEGAKPYVDAISGRCAEMLAEMEPPSPAEAQDTNADQPVEG